MGISVDSELYSGGNVLWGIFFVQIVFVDMIRSLLWVSMRTRVWDSWDSPEFRSKAAVDTPLACRFLICQRTAFTVDRSKAVTRFNTKPTAGGGWMSKTHGFDDPERFRKTGKTKMTRVRR